MTAAALSRAVAEAKGWTRRKPDRQSEADWVDPEGCYHFDYEVAHLFADPARLYELEGELFREAIYTYFIDDRKIWLCRVGNSVFKEPGTPDGRVRLILRATLEMKR